MSRPALEILAELRNAAQPLVLLPAEAGGPTTIHDERWYMVPEEAVVDGLASAKRVIALLAELGPPLGERVNRAPQPGDVVSFGDKPGLWTVHEVKEHERICVVRSGDRMTTFIYEFRMDPELHPAFGRTSADDADIPVFVWNTYARWGTPEEMGV